MLYDGGIKFFGRVSTVLKSSDALVDFVAGRGAWFDEDHSEPCKHMRNFKSMAMRINDLDLDPIVMSNPTTTEDTFHCSRRLASV